MRGVQRLVVRYHYTQRIGTVTREKHEQFTKLLQNLSILGEDMLLNTTQKNGAIPKNLAKLCLGVISSDISMVSREMAEAGYKKQ